MAGRFTKEFQAEAVKLVLEQGLERKQVCQDLGIGKSTLDRWVNDAQGNVIAENPLSESERSELNRLRKELAAVKMERDFLKKASAYFAKN